MTVEPSEVEAYLLARTGWVSAEELCRVFKVGERAFRGLRKRPGLCSGFAISGDHGFKHVELATTGEWIRFKGRIIWHAIGELRRVRRLTKRRALVQRRGAPVATERDTGQLMFFSRS
jgi:hypothetical protein